MFKHFLEMKVFAHSSTIIILYSLRKWMRFDEQENALDGLPSNAARVYLLIAVHFDCRGCVL